MASSTDSETGFTAVILAAGSGQRFRDLNVAEPKPMLRLGGLSLLERTARTAFRAGARRIVIVLGARAEDIQGALEQPLSDVPIHWVVNANWELGNGTSVLAAEPHVGPAPFLILMADHLVFSPMLRRIWDAVRNGNTTIAVDFKRGGLQDPDDATKVKLENGRIAAIDKKLTDFDGYDTGVSVCTAELFQVLHGIAAGQGGRCSHTEGMRRLAESGRLAAFDIGGDRWEDVDNPDSLKTAEALLMQSLRKPTDGFMSRHLERHLSGWVTRRLMNTRVHPNQITASLILLGGLAALCFAQPGLSWAIFGAALFWCTSFLDGCDGEIARLKFQESRWGGWLDLWSDNLVHAMVFMAIGIRLWRETAEAQWIYLGLAAVAGVFLSVGWVTLQRMRRSGSGPLFTTVSEGTAPGPGTWAQRLSRLADALSRRDFIFGVIFIAAFGWLPAFLWAAAIGSHIYWIVLVLIFLAYPLKSNPANA